MQFTMVLTIVSDAPEDRVSSHRSLSLRSRVCDKALGRIESIAWSSNSCSDGMDRLVDQFLFGSNGLLGRSVLVRIKWIACLID
jgi:hypothetical protein